VFDVNRRPWIEIDAVPPDQIAAAVRRCPTGALSFTSDTITDELPDRAEMRPIRGGPLVVRGEVELVDSEGNVCIETRVTLCRCGNSGNQPYCDNSHRTDGFDEPEFRAPAPVEAPDQICEPQPGFEAD
jgi:CDGSH-type Zn-finger protein